MASTCTKCDGKGFIRGFSHIADGECFRCMGTGRFLTVSEKAAISTKRADAHDLRMAKEQGVSLEILRAYVGKGPVPKHPNGYSFSIQEFAEWRAGA